MGGEFGQWREWTETQSLDWHLLDSPLHSGVQKLIRDLNQIYLERDALWHSDADATGFEWIDVDNAAENIVAFLRRTPETANEIICVSNFSAVRRETYRLALPREGRYQVLINTDNIAITDLESEPVAARGRENSALIDLPPLSTMWLCMRSSRS